MQTLLPFQEQGVDFLTTPIPALSNKPHKLLADFPGAGKTVQISAAAARLRIKNSLIIVPASLDIKEAWKRHFLTWGVTDNPDDIHIVTTTQEKVPNVRHIIASYELLTHKEEVVLNQLNSRRYDLVSVDEAHRLKALTSKRSKTLLSADALLLRGRHKWMITGTPMPNRPIEMYPMLKTMAPECIRPYDTVEKYGEYFCGAWKDRWNKWHYDGATHADEFRERLKPFMLCRRMEDVFDQLPPLIEKDVFVDIPGYNGGMKEDIRYVEDEAEPLATTRRLLGEAKLPYAIEYIKDRMAALDEPILVFAYSRSVCEGLGRALNCPIIYGGMTAKQKQQALAQFTSKKEKVLVAQINSAGEGIDGMQRVCNVVIFVEFDWSAGAWDQALARLYRIGQERPVYAHYFRARGTLDESIVGTYFKKKRFLDVVMTTNLQVRKYGENDI